MKLKFTLAVNAVTTLAVNAASIALLSQEDAEYFSRHFTGDGINSVGGVMQNGWVNQNPSHLTLTTTGTVLDLATGTGTGEWLEGTPSTNGSETWNEGVVGETDPHTLEWNLRSNDNDASNNGFVLWNGNDGGRNELSVHEDGITITKTGVGLRRLQWTLPQVSTRCV